MITRNFNLYLNAGHSVPLVINVNQYDSGEQWVFTLYNSDGTQYTPSTGAIVGIKSDGLGIINSGSVVDGKVVINETEQMTAAVGKAVFELLIDSQTHGTANFVVLVEEKPGNNADLSESDLSLLQEAIDATSPLPTGGTVGQVLTKTASGSTWSDAGTPTQEQVADAVSDWADEHITVSTGVVIDTSLAVAGAAADSKKVGDEITDLKSAIEQGGGLSAEVKQALMNCFDHVAWKDNDPNASTYINALQNALYPPANLTSISAVYTQSGAVYETDSLDSLKADLVVTAHYSDSTSEVVTAYTLSGILTVGISTITVAYGGKSTTFTVNVSEAGALYSLSNVWYDGWSETDTELTPLDTNIGFTMLVDAFFMENANNWRLLSMGNPASPYESLNIQSSSASNASIVWMTQSATFGLANTIEEDVKIALWHEEGSNVLNYKAKVGSNEAVSGTITSSFVSISGNMFIGGRSGVVNRYFRGLLNSFKLYDSVLDTSDIDSFISDAPSTATTLSSISASIDQSATIYGNENVNNIRQYLTVTAHYANGQSKAVTNYELSGILTEGTSTVTVTFESQTTTVNVTVSEARLLPSGRHVFSTTNEVVTVSNGNHIAVDFKARQSGAFINLSDLSKNGADITSSASVNNLSDVLFNIPANSTVELKMLNATPLKSSLVASGGQVAIAFRKTNGSTSAFTGVRCEYYSEYLTSTETVSASTDVSCAFMYYKTNNTNIHFECDIELTVNGTRII